MKTIKPCKVDGEVPPRVDLKQIFRLDGTPVSKVKGVAKAVVPDYIQKCLDEMFHDVCN